jgi:hypothetical protein
MKIRLDFVTNSSSSSYICEICGDEYSDYDASLSDAGMTQCENGHTFCDSHMGPDNKRLAVIEAIRMNLDHEEPGQKVRLMTVIGLLESKDPEIMDELEELYSEYELRYDMPERGCPICTFTRLTDTVIADYLLKKYNVDQNQLKDELKEKFATFKDYRNYVK